MIIPPAFLTLFFVLALLLSYLQTSGAFAPTLEAAAAIAAFFLVLHYASLGRAMGFSDAPFAAALALMAGSWQIALSGLVYAFWIGAAGGILVLVGRPRGSRMGIEVPFAPYLALGFLLAYFTQWNLLTLIGLSP
jgi:prepilin signal peptidase PulO-like enzyme (type II secretory pathway)